MPNGHTAGHSLFELIVALGILGLLVTAAAGAAQARHRFLEAKEMKQNLLDSHAMLSGTVPASLPRSAVFDYQGAESSVYRSTCRDLLPELELDCGPATVRARRCDLETESGKSARAAAIVWGIE